MAEEYMLDEKALKLIEATLRKGDRIELIPAKNCVKIISVKRRELKPEKHG